MVCDEPSAISSWLVRRGRSRCTGSEAKSRDQMSATRASNDGVAMERVDDDDDDDSDDDTLSLAPLLVVLLEIEMLVSSEGSMAATAPPCVADAGADDGAGDGAGGADNDDNDNDDGGDRVADGADEARGGW